MLSGLYRALTVRSPTQHRVRHVVPAPEARPEERSNPVAQVLVAQETERSAAQIIRSLQLLFANADRANKLTGALNKLQKSLASAITAHTPAENAQIEHILNTPSSRNSPNQ